MSCSPIARIPIHHTVVATFLAVVSADRADAAISALGRDGITVENVAQHLLQMTAQESASGHVYTLHAELEGQKWMPIFEQLLQGWQQQGYELVSMHRYLQGLDRADLPRHEVTLGSIEGRSGTLAIQS